MKPTVAKDVLELIGRTPLVRLNKVTKGLKARVYAKLEYTNPGGSVKDRIGLAMVLAAEAKGLLKPGYTIVEPTSGNTGMGLALAAVVRGYKITFTVPDKMSREKIDVLRAVGAKVWVTPTKVPPGDPRNYVEVAKRIARENPRTYMPNQYENLANPQAHYETTGPEIWEQTEGKVNMLVAGVGTGGTISGTGRYLKERNPSVKVVGADPAGSILAASFEGKKTNAFTYKTEGIGEDFFPKTLDMKVIDEFVTVTDREAFETSRRLAREEGLLAGGSSGAAVFAALKVAKRLGPSSTVVVILPDTGRNYIKKVFSDDWMAAQGYLKRGGSKVSVDELLASSESRPPFPGPRDTLQKAANALDNSHASSLPVVDDGVQVGSISDLVLIRESLKSARWRSVVLESVMEEPLPSVEKGSKLVDPAGALGEHGAFVVIEGSKVTGLVTAGDVLSHLTRR